MIILYLQFCWTRRLLFCFSRVSIERTTQKACPSTKFDRCIRVYICITYVTFTDLINYIRINARINSPRNECIETSTRVFFAGCNFFATEIYEGEYEYYIIIIITRKYRFFRKSSSSKSCEKYSTLHSKLRERYETNTRIFSSFPSTCSKSRD